MAEPASISLRHLTLEWGRRTYIMGVLNVTPDSFSGDGATDLPTSIARARQMLAEGADLVDVGGESTRPGATPVSREEELRRVLPVVEALVGELDAAVSVDTKKAAVARRVLRAGALMINDVSALADPEMAEAVAEFRAAVVLMHGYGTKPDSSVGAFVDVMSEVRAFLKDRIEAAVATGTRRDHIFVDPGFGFGKTVAQNLEVLRRLGELRVLGLPIVIGPSRKGTIGQIMGGLPVQDRVEGTAAAVTVSIMNGADMVRVHDVRVMARVARATDAIVRARVEQRRAP